MVQRLRDVYTGEVYGWNREMAKLKYLEEFDDEDPNHKWKGPRIDEPVKQAVFPRYDPAVSDDKDEVLQQAIASAAKKTETELKTLQVPTEQELEQMSEAELAAEIARLDAIVAQGDAAASAKKK